MLGGVNAGNSHTSFHNKSVRYYLFNYSFSKAFTLFFPERWSQEFLDYVTQYVPMFAGTFLFPDDNNETSVFPGLKNFSLDWANIDDPNRVSPGGRLINRQVSTFDAFKFAEIYVPNSCLTDDIYAYNESYDTLIGQQRQDGSIEAPEFNPSVRVTEDNMFPLNPRRNPKKAEERFYRYMVTPGYRFSQKNVYQTLQVIQKRYAGPVKNYPFDFEGDQLADKIAQEFVDEHLELNDSRRRVDEYVLNELWRSWNSAAESKKYFNMFRGHDDYDWATVAFHLKTIFKPKMFLKLEQLNKVGQGISAWGKDAQILFAMVGRVLNTSLVSMMKKTCIYDNKITQQELFEKIKHLNGQIPSVALNGVTDMTEFDKNQNLFSQRIEFHIWRRMGFDIDMLDHYYSLRSNYRIRSEAGTAKVKAAKTSGEPLTLANNTILAAAISNYLLRGIGPFYMVMKGDDLWKRQCNLKLISERLDEIQKYVNFELRVTIEDAVEYCGNIVTTSGMYPNLQRKLYKILSHSFRDYKHFAEYQISLRDFMNLCYSLDTGTLAAVNMEMIGCGYEQATGLLDCIQSFAHISERQFLDNFRLEKIEYGVPVTSFNNKYTIVY